MKKLAKVKVKKYGEGDYDPRLDPRQYTPNQVGKYTTSLDTTGNNTSALGRDVGATTVQDQSSGFDWNQAGNYAKIAGAGAVAFSNINNNPNLTQQQKADSYYESGKMIGSSINPIVGAAWNIGDAIGTPIKNKSERLNEDGTLRNKNDAQAAAIVGGIFNPLKALTTRGTYKGGYLDITGKGYVNHLEEEGKAAYEAEQERLATEAEAERVRKYNEQMNYTKAYNTANPITGREGTGIYARGGRLMSAYCSYGNGGVLDPISSVATKAIGDTHEEGGITLQSGGTPIAEVEDGEIISQGKVFSNRLKVRPGVTYAKEAEKLERKRGKLEEATETNNYREKNSATRMMNNVNQDINNLFAMQEISKAKKLPKFGGIPKAKDGINLNTIYKPKRRELTEEEIQDEQDYAMGNMSGNYAKIDWNRAAQQITPYLDNIYNEGIINSTPDIPRPTNRVAYDVNPITLKTNYNINPALNSANANYNALVRNLDQNTSNAPTARANKLAGFASLLNNTSSLYNTKENTETQLANQNNMNVQNIIARNSENQQNIANQNIGLKDNFNYARIQRQSDINRMKSQNFTNAVENMTIQAQDRNLETLDQQRIMTDALKYNDGAGFARIVGSPTMTNIIRSNPQYYYQIEKALKSSGQNDALKEFYKTYGRKSS